MTPAPPDWAQTLVSMLVPAKTRESVLGDLLEEYRDERVPADGEQAADRWYARQALGFLWSASLPVALATSGNLSARLLLDIVMAPPARDFHDRALITTFVAMGIFALFGFRLGRSTGRMLGAAVVALVGTAIATVLAYAFTLAFMGVEALLLHPDAGTWAALVEGLDIPAPVIAAVGLALASAGASIGRLFTGSSGSRASIRT